MISALREAKTGRLRASLRALLPAIVTVPLVVVASFMVPSAVGQLVDSSTVTGLALNFVAQWVAVYIIPIAIALGLALRLDRGSLARFGLDVDRPWLINWGIGFGISLAAVILWLSYGAGRGLFAVHPERITDFGAASLGLGLAVLGLALAFVFLGNIWEEIVFRGIMLQNFAEGLFGRGFSRGSAAAGATVASLVFFGAYHVPFRGLFFGMLTIPTGFVFALAYLYTGRLGLAIGVHMGRFPLELMQGRDLGAMEFPTVLEVGSLSLAETLESVVVLDGVSCLLILAGVFFIKGKIEIADRIYEPSAPSEHGSNQAV